LTAALSSAQATAPSTGGCRVICRRLTTVNQPQAPKLRAALAIITATPTPPTPRLP
jgi:hypothetical protein